MARIRRDSSDSYDGNVGRKIAAQKSDYQPEGRTTRTSPRKKPAKRESDHDDDAIYTAQQDQPTLPSRDLAINAKRGKQVRLAPLKSLRDMSDLSAKLLATTLLDEADSASRRSPAKRPVIRSCKVTAVAQESRDAPEREIVVEADDEESVWCGSDASSEASEDELPSPRKFIKFPPSKALREVGQQSDGLDLARGLELLSLGSLPVPKQADGFPKHEISDSSRPTSSSDKENDDRAILRFTPPRLCSPRKAPLTDRPTTPPPASPSKARLQSPSKRPPRVPTPPFRPSLDAFWNAETVNDWNDQYSPRKEWSPKKLRENREDATASPTASPKKPQSPTKRTKAEIAAKKDWGTRKHEVAQNFLAELDRKVTDGKVGELSATTGGVKFVWSKTLNTTAGRANWRRETTKTRHSNGTTTATHKHHASIELAEKVIDDEERLLNVVAHEFCHLANFMVSGIKDQPHGKQFKAWGAICTRAFGHRGVEVTTKHSYQIEYKYIWRCSNEDCAVEFKRHSKSIDPKRQTCGACRSTLLQIKPVPRKDAAGSDGATTGYAAYVKNHFASVKASLPAGASQKEVMEAVGRRYREEKASNAARKGLSQGVSGSKVTSLSSAVLSEKLQDPFVSAHAEVDDVARAMEVIVIDDD